MFYYRLSNKAENKYVKKCPTFNSGNVEEILSSIYFYFTFGTFESRTFTCYLKKKNPTL